MARVLGIYTHNIYKYDGLIHKLDINIYTSMFNEQINGG